MWNNRAAHRMQLDTSNEIRQNGFRMVVREYEIEYAKLVCGIQRTRNSRCVQLTAKHDKCNESGRAKCKMVMNIKPRKRKTNAMTNIINFNVCCFVMWFVNPRDLWSHFIDWYMVRSDSFAAVYEKIFHVVIIKLLPISICCHRNAFELPSLRQ